VPRRRRHRPAPWPPRPWCWPAPLITALVKPCTSSCVMRPLGPEPLTSSSGTPSSRANLRTEGEACGRCRWERLWARAAAARRWAATRQQRLRPSPPAGAAAACAAREAGAPAALAPRAFEHRDQVADIDLVADLDLELLQHAGRRRRNLHRRLVRLDRDQRLLGLDRVADLDEQLDDRDVLEVADVGHRMSTGTPSARACFAQGCGSRGRRGRRRACSRSRRRAPGAAAGAGGAAAPASSASSTSTTEPSTLSPTSTLISFTTPAVDDGISIEALSIRP
jgi:hypothetical protein